MTPTRRRIEAFMDDPDEDRPNPIHSTHTARRYGFKGALIGGATAYGWTVASIVEALGDGWLDHGWAKLAFRQPMYPGDVLNVDIDAVGEMRVQREETLCFSGRVGLGDAVWLDELVLPAGRTPEPADTELPRLTLADAPVGQDLKPRLVTVDVAESLEFNLQRQRETLAVFSGARPRVHPAWIAEQLIHLLHHSYEYGPSIHTRSRIQHLAPAYAGQAFTIRGHCREVYERKGHHYIVNDGAIDDAQGRCVARLRHTAIFQIAGRTP